MLAHSVMGPSRNVPTADGSRAGVAIVNAPLVHIGGVSGCCNASPRQGLSRCWTASTSTRGRRRAQASPRAVSLVPAALRMVLHSALAARTSRHRAVTSGTAPLSADDADAFQEKFGIPVLTSYAATEFGGGVAGWTLADHQKHWQPSVAASDAPIPGAHCGWSTTTATRWPRPTGLLEVKPASSGRLRTGCARPIWPRIDDDGFLWILGRADQAIIRGGFKVMPDDVRAALESHPAVRGAAVVGRPDDRLGRHPSPCGAEGHRDCRRRRTADFCGTGWRATRFPPRSRSSTLIPRTPSGKPDLSAIRGG
jgi:acyl-coenzyme A synthetase/AMP-(fatty) acid ligase